MDIKRISAGGEGERLFPDYEYFIKLLKDNNLGEVEIKEIVGGVEITVILRARK